jgi:hypothetical protein
MANGDRHKLLFFTRGRGRGHAIPDLAILEQLRALAPDIEVTLASYAAGGQTLREAGHAILDLQLPDDADHQALIIRTARAIVHARPDFLVSHEEFAALTAAKIFALPTALVVDFFPMDEVRRPTLLCADHILFIEQRGMFAEPPESAGKIEYLGPVLRPLALSRADRAQARQQLEVADGTRLISVIPGAWATEERAPIFDLVLGAFQALPLPDKKLVWNAGAERDQLSRRAAGVPGVMVIERCNPVDRLMVASDLCLTKGNRGTTIDLARLGIPSISLSHGVNRVDEAIIPRLHNNQHLHAGGIDSAFLAAAIQRALSAAPAAPGGPESTFYSTSAAPAVARRIAELVRQQPNAVSRPGHG